MSRPDGSFVLPDLGGSSNVWVRVSDSRFALDTFRVDREKPGAVGEFRLDPAAPLTVEVRDAGSGLPIPNARVTIITDRIRAHPHFCVTEHGILGPRFVPANIDEVTDVRAVVRVSLASGDRAEILVHAPSSAGPYVGTRTWIELSNKQGERKLVVRMPHGRWVNGTVRDATGQPVAGAAVHWGRENATQPEWRDAVLVGCDAITRTARDGTFRLAVLPGTSSLRVYGPTLNFPPVLTKLPGAANTTLFAHAITRIEVPEHGELPRVNATLCHSESVIGRIDGHDTQSGTFFLCSGRVSPVRGYASLPLAVKTDQFTVPGCREGQITRVYILDAGGRIGGVADVTPSLATPVVRLAECGLLRFRVVGSDGHVRAAQDVSVALLVDRDRCITEPILAEPVADPQPVEWFDPVDYPTRPKTNAEGVVELPVLIPGARCAVSVGSGANKVVVGRFLIEAGKTITLPDVILPVPSEGGMR